MRALLLPAFTIALGACGTDQLTSVSDEPATAAEPTAQPITPTPLFATSFRGGIPFGTFALPNTDFGSVYNGAMRNIYPEYLLRNLADIKARGGRVVLMFAGKESFYKDSNGHFSMAMWKARVDRFKGVDFSSYVADGTIIGHYLIDEPNDKTNWNGIAIPGSTVEEMAKYSKTLWPKMATVVRAYPDYMAEWSGTYHYLDAAWAQYVVRKGDIRDFSNRMVAAAKSKGLALIVGLNILAGDADKTALSATQVESWGSVLLADSYPCAFISWKYYDPYLSRTDIKAAMARLSQKAAAHTARSCGGSTTTEPPPPDDSTDPPTLPGVNGIVLKGYVQKIDGVQYARMKWAGASGSTVDVYRNTTFKRNIENDGAWRNAPPPGKYTYRICLRGLKTTEACSNALTVTIPTW